MATTSAHGAERLATTSIEEWMEDDVADWVAAKGYPQYSQQLIENSISGPILCLLDHDALKELGIHLVGHRMNILKEVYQLKVAQGIPIEDGHYIPPSQTSDTLVHASSSVSIDRLHELILELSDRTRTLEHENRRLAEALNYVAIHLPSKKTNSLDSEATLRSSAGPFGTTSGQSTVPPTPNASRMNGNTSHRMTDTTMVESPQTSPARPEIDLSSTLQSQLAKSSSLSRPPTTPNPHISSSESSSRTPIHRSHSQSQLAHSQQQPVASSSTSTSRPSEKPSTTTATGGIPTDPQLRSFKVSIDDPCWKVLPAALKKYKINDDWRKYVMFICHGSTERCLSYDEKPLLLFQKLKDANKNPVFMLRHIKDIRSPIAVAQQKQGQRSRDNTSNVAPGSAATPDSGSGSGAGYSRNTRLHQPNVLHPISAQAQAATASAAHAASSTDEPSPHPNINETLSAAAASAANGGGGSGAGGMGGLGASYALAIYPYTAEQDDEFDVTVDDTFIIRSREKGWWIVQRDVNGTGVPSPNPSPAGADAPKWVPAGCLLETTIPPHQAMQESRTTIGSSLSPSPTASPVGASAKRQILPSHIISTSFPGIALMGYGDKGEHELALARGDVLRVFKRYNHWSYAIKEENGERGWVPSWFIGKYTPDASSSSSTATPPALVPPTPTSGSTTASSNTAHATGEHSPSEPMPTMNGMNGIGAHLGLGVNGTGNAGNGSSPMSQAFPVAGHANAHGNGSYVRSAVTLI